MVPRFYGPDSTGAGQLIDLPADEAGHLIRVLRLGTGASIRIFNGRGGEFEATVEAIAGRRVRVRTDAPCAAAREPRVAVTLAQAVLKGDKMDEVVRDAVMIGAAAIQPVITARAECPAASASRRRERWERIAVASAKQCGRATLPPILAPLPFAAAMGAFAAQVLPAPGLMFVEPSASSATVAPADLDSPPPLEATILIGPEGGWTPEEIEEASDTCRLVTLGGRTLRADAMALVALTALFTTWRAL